MRPGCTLNLLEANLLSKQEHAFPTMARHYCLRSVCCWNLCSGFAELLHSNILLHLYLWSWQFLCQFRTWNLPSGFIQTLPRMCYWSLRSDTSFPSSRRKSDLESHSLENSHWKCWSGAERRQWQKCVRMKNYDFAFIQLKFQKISLKY